MNTVTVQLNGSTSTIQLNDKIFSTGSKGFHGFGKLDTGTGKKYQLNVMAIEIGSKPKA